MWAPYWSTTDSASPWISTLRDRHPTSARISIVLPPISCSSVAHMIISNTNHIAWRDLDGPCRSAVSGAPNAATTLRCGYGDAEYSYCKYSSVRARSAL